MPEVLCEGHFWDYFIMMQMTDGGDFLSVECGLLKPVMDSQLSIVTVTMQEGFSFFEGINAD